MAASTINIVIGRAFLGHDLAYIYVLYSKAHHVLYVGQTNVRGGVLSRLGSHLEANGTFRVRLLEVAGIDVEEIEDLALYGFPLPVEAEYLSTDETYREGVEYQLQIRLRQVGGDWNPYFRIVSNVTAPITTSFPQVDQLAQGIFDTFAQLYHA